MTKSILDSDHHGWAELLPERSAQPALQEIRSVDWVIVGAGVTGMACARKLAELAPDTDILLLEGREVAQGATARSSGFAVDSSRFGGPLSKLDLEDCRRVNSINRRGLQILRDTVQQNDIDCDWREDGLFHGAADQKSLAEFPHYLSYLDKMGLGYTVLSNEEATERLGTSIYEKAVLVHDGALVQPAALVRDLADSLPKNVTLYENSPVLEVKQGDPHELVLPGGSVRAKNIILATNYELTKLGFLKNRITGIVLSGSFTRQLTDEEMDKLGSLKDWGVMSLHETGATVRLTVDRRICVRNMNEFRFSRLLPDAQLSGRVAKHRAAFEARFPQLSNVPFEFSWSGVEGVSRNLTNFFGKIAQNLWFAGGYNGSGLSRGTAFGTAIADHAYGNDTELAQDCLKSKPAIWMPPEPFRSIGGNFTILRRSASVGRDQ